jgi:hypothetical protein
LLQGLVLAPLAARRAPLNFSLSSRSRSSGVEALFLSPPDVPFDGPRLRRADPASAPMSR